MFYDFIQNHTGESLCVAVVLVLLIWYYFEVYKKGKSIHDIMSKEKKSTCQTTVEVKQEEFENNISSHINRFDTDTLKKNLYM